MHSVRRKGSDRVPDLQGALAVSNQKPERRLAMKEQAMQHVRGAGAVAKDRRAVKGLRVRRRRGQLAADARRSGRGIGDSVLDQAFCMQSVIESEAEPS